MGTSIQALTQNVLNFLVIKSMFLEIPETNSVLVWAYSGQTLIYGDFEADAKQSGFYELDTDDFCYHGDSIVSFCEYIEAVFPEGKAWAEICAQIAFRKKRNYNPYIKSFK